MRSIIMFGWLFGKKSTDMAPIVINTNASSQLEEQKMHNDIMNEEQMQLEKEIESLRKKSDVVTTAFLNLKEKYEQQENQISELCEKIDRLEKEKENLESQVIKCKYTYGKFKREIDKKIYMPLPTIEFNKSQLLSFVKHGTTDYLYRPYVDEKDITSSDIKYLKNIYGNILCHVRKSQYVSGSDILRLFKMETNKQLVKRERINTVSNIGLYQRCDFTIGKNLVYVFNLEALEEFKEYIKELEKNLNK